MTVAWPRVPGALAALLPTVAGWSAVEVFRGPPVSDSDPDVYCTVAFVLGEDSSGDFNQEIDAVDGLNGETGAVRCELVVKGDGFDDLGRAADLIDALDARLRADQTLGGVLGDDGSTVTLGADWLLTQNSSGAQVRVALSVGYFCRTA